MVVLWRWLRVREREGELVGEVVQSVFNIFLNIQYIYLLFFLLCINGV